MLKTIFKTTVPAMALAFATLQAPAAMADTYILDIGSMDHQRTVNIAGIGNVYAAPMHFKATENGAPVDLLAWCVDVYHHITLADYSPNLPYTDTVAHTTDFAGHPLDAGDTSKIGLLANYGQAVYDADLAPPPAFTEVKPTRGMFPSGSAGTAAYNAALMTYNQHKSTYDTALAAYNTAVADRWFRLSAVQSAIWQVASNLNVTSSDFAYDLLVDNLSGANAQNFFGAYSAGSRNYTLITPIQQYGGANGRTPLALTQSFVFASAPEPMTWALMIGGLGLTGVVLRRQRRAGAAVA